MTEPSSFLRAERLFAARFGDRRGTRRWWVPGRIELLGKHVDYGGGRSLLAAVNRGFTVIARPRRDSIVNLVDGRSAQFFSGTMSLDLEQQPGRWTDYPITVLRRLAQDFPEAEIGMDAVLTSDLPSSAGLSSSSALVIATFLPIAAINLLSRTELWTYALGSDEALADYLGAVENGRAFAGFAAGTGVGTMGGSQDHTAIMCCRQGTLSQFRFLPVARQDEVAIPPGHLFAVASSGVAASKTGAVRQHYNGLSGQMAELVRIARQVIDLDSQSLLDLLNASSDAAERLAMALRREADGDRLARRLHQFDTECRTIIPGVVASLRSGDLARAGELVDRSQRLAEEVLGNQIPETVRLAASARELGAAAASAFGAGFGGSVWALIPAGSAEEFLERWRARYLSEFPARGRKAEFFLTGASQGAHEVHPPETSAERRSVDR